MKKLIKFISVFMVMVMIFPYVTKVIVYADDSPTYISEVKIANATNTTFYAENEAKASLTRAGYLVLDSNLNAGTGRPASFVGYKTTKNEKEAITDLAVMDMDGGYELNNLSATLAHYKGTVEKKATGMLEAAKEFKANFDKGSPAAKLAMQALNYMVVKRNSNQPLGKYLTDSSRTVDNFKDIVLKCDPNILVFILSQLSLGVADYKTETWIEKYSKKNPNAIYPPDSYHETAMTIYPQIQAFAKRYAEAIEKYPNYNEIDFDNPSMVKAVDDVVSEDTTSKDVPHKDKEEMQIVDTPDELVASEAVSSEVVSSENNSSEVTSSEATSSEVTSSEATSSEVISSENTSSKAVSSEATSSEVISSEATSSKAVSSQSTSSKDTSSKEELPKDNYENGLAMALNTDESEETDTISPEIMRTFTAYEMLNEYTFNGDGIGDIFTDLHYASELYPLISALSQQKGTLAMMANSDIETFAINLANNTDKAEATCKELSIQMEKEAGPLKGVDIWENTVESVFEDKEVGLTSKALRELNAQDNLDALAITDSKKQGLSIAMQSLSGIAGVGMAIAQITWQVMATSFGAKFAFSTITTTIGSTCSAGVGGAFAGSIFAGSIVVLGLCVLALIGIAIYYLVDAIKKEIEYNNPKFKDIPASMFDFFENVDDPDDPNNVISRYVEYTAATDMSGRSGDLNAWNGLKWNALYWTKDAAAGSPIKADFIVKNGDGTIPIDYSPLHKFGELTAFDTNTNMREDSLRGTFVFFQRKDGNREKVEGEFLSDIIVREGATQTEVMSYFTVRGYTPIKRDLLTTGGAIGNKKVAYLGYKTTRSQNDAIRDIRVASNCDIAQLTIGDASYTNAGKYIDTTLYYSKLDITGDPVLADFFITNRIREKPPTSDFVPISLIAGGPAANLTMPVNPTITLKIDKNYKDVFSTENIPQLFIYYRSSVSYDTGPNYVSGFASFQSKDKQNIDKTAQVMYMNGYTYIGKDLTNGSGPVHYYTNRMAYSTTKNPKRALKKVYTYYSPLDDILLSPITKRDGVGYVAVPRYDTDMSSYGNGTGSEVYYYYTLKLNAANSIIQYDATTAMYVTSATRHGEYFTIGDVEITNYPYSNGSGPSDFYGVSDWFDTSFSASNIKKGCWQTNSLYMYIRGKKSSIGKYISRPIVGGAAQSEYNAQLNLFEQGAVQTMANIKDYGSFYDRKEKIYYKINTVLGVDRTSDFNYAMTGMKIVAIKGDGASTQPPRSEMTMDRMTYKLASPKPFAFIENNRLYIYYTTNPGAGEPITDITWRKDEFSLSGYENVGYHEEKYSTPTIRSIDEILKDQEFNHVPIPMLFVRRTNTSSNVYLKNIEAIYAPSTGGIWNLPDLTATKKLAMMGYSYIVKDEDDDPADMNDGNGGEYIYIGYNKTSNKDDAITGLRVQIHKPSKAWDWNNPSSTNFYNGVRYHLINNAINFNQGSTNAYGVYLYYTKSPGAGSPITDLLAYHDYRWDPVRNQDGNGANFNAGDYVISPGAIYLNHKKANGVVSNRDFWDTASVFVTLTPISTITVFAIMITSGIVLVTFHTRRRRKAKTENV